MTFTGPQIAEPLQRRAPDFEKLTGAKVNVITVPFSDLYQKLLTDWSTGTNSIDAGVFAPQWMVDYVDAGPPRGSHRPRRQGHGASSRTTSRRSSASSRRNTTARPTCIPLDGDFQMVYYRTDVLKELGLEPPKTWDDYLAIAKAANGKDMNGDGKPDYGSCISKKRNAQAYWFIYRSGRPDRPGQGHRRKASSSTLPT